MFATLDLVFALACWRQTSILRLMLRDADSILSQLRNGRLESNHALLIRLAEKPLRVLLDRDWNRECDLIEPLAKKNRSRLMIFDSRIESAINSSDSFDSRQLGRTLEIWQDRLKLDTPGLLMYGADHLSETSEWLVSLDEMEGLINDPKLFPIDPIGQLMFAWVKVSIRPEYFEVLHFDGCQQLQVSAKRLLELVEVP